MTCVFDPSKICIGKNLRISISWSREANLECCPLMNKVGPTKVIFSKVVAGDWLIISGLAKKDDMFTRHKFLPLGFSDKIRLERKLARSVLLTMRFSMA